MESLKKLVLEKSDDGDIKKSIDISELYTILVMRGIKFEETEESNMEDNGIREFIAILENRLTYALFPLRVSGFLKNKSAKNAKENLRNLANNIQYYYKNHKEENLKKEEKQELCALYSKILYIYAENPETDIPKALQQKYKEIVNRYSYVNE